jgi:hypothetical protein
MVALVAFFFLINLEKKKSEFLKKKRIHGYQKKKLVNFFLYFKKMVFCKCQECKALNIVAGGREVSTVTKWRHNKKETEWHTYLDNFDSMFSINDPLTNQENEL